MRNRLTTVCDGQSPTSALGDCIEGSAATAYDMARRFCGDSEEAEELVQETAYRVLRNWDRYDSTKPLNRWFFGVMRNAFIDSRRRFETRRVISLDAPAAENGGDWEELVCGSDETPLEYLERKDTVQAVRKAFDGLRKEHRTILKLCHMDGLRYGDIAERLDIPVGTVRSRVFRARKALRAQSPELAAMA